MASGGGGQVRLPAALIFDLGALFYDWFTSQSEWRRSCLRLAAGLPPGARILDLGCGPGVSSIALARRVPGSRVLGVDLAARMLGQARRHVRRGGLDGRV